MYMYMDKLKNKFNLKNLALLLVMIYSVAVIYWVARDDGFYGIRFLSIWSVVIMWLLIVFFIDISKKSKNKNIEEIEKYKNIKIYYVGIFFIFMPMFMELPDKLAILFYNIETGYEKEKVYNVEIKGYFKTGTSKRGGDIWATAKDIADERYSYVMVCNLISKVECNLGDLKGERVVIKLSRNNNYPLKDESVVYGFKSKNLNIDEKEWINLYKENKRYIFLFLSLIYIPSILFSLFVPRLFKSDTVSRES